MMKKIIAILLAVVILTSAAVYVVNMPEFTLYKMSKEIKQEGLTAVESYLTDDLKPMFQTVVMLSSQPWLAGLINDASTQELLSILSSEAAMTWKLGEVRRGSKTASVLVEVDSAAFAAQIGLELVREDGKWLINGFTLPSFSLKEMA